MRLAAALAAALVLAGCQALPRAVPPLADGTPAAEAFAARRAGFAALEAWTLRGRVAVNAHGRGWNGSLHWRQTGESLDLRFIAPLGAGSVRISGSPGHMRIQASDGTDYFTEDAAGELARWLGTPLPLAALRWWVLGLPPPGVAISALELDAAGRATAFEHAGWRVRLPRYTEHDGRIVPGIIEAEADGVKLRLIVDRWEARR